MQSFVLVVWNVCTCIYVRDVNKDWAPKDQDKDKDMTPKDKDTDLNRKDKDRRKRGKDINCKLSFVE